jgi:two-component system OmpR family sensor kinase
VSKLIVGIAIIAAVAIAASIFIALLTVKYALGPLQRMAETASRVAEMPLDRGEVALDARVPEEDTDARTEVGRVGAAMNRMLGHVSHALTARQLSENKVRQFVADASHELRTPLASVRGYAELTRRMGKDLPEDVVYAMGRIESESVRMTSLVEELLLLARLDEGTDLVLKDVDMTRIVLDAVHDTHVADTGHRYEVSVPEEPIQLQGDPMRLHQVVANLLGNARTHTPEGTEVWVTLERDDAAHEAVVTVADNGPGIDPAVMPVLFERFARGDSSRSRKAGSTGLGLAIVQAVVNSHGGTVTASAGDPGAVFTVRLPLVRILPQGTPVPLPAPEPARS